jgi:hypothetical protein
MLEAHRDLEERALDLRTGAAAGEAGKLLEHLVDRSGLAAPRDVEDLHESRKADGACRRVRTVDVHQHDLVLVTALGQVERKQ